MKKTNQDEAVDWVPERMPGEPLEAYHSRVAQAALVQYVNEPGASRPAFLKWILAAMAAVQSRLVRLLLSKLPLTWTNPQ